MMKTERLTTFPGNIITETFISTLTASDAPNSRRSEMLSSLMTKVLTVVTCAMVAFVCVLAWATHDLHQSVRGQMTYLQSSKAVVLHWVSPERGKEYLIYTVERNRQVRDGR